MIDFKISKEQIVGIKNQQILTSQIIITFQFKNNQQMRNEALVQDESLDDIGVVIRVKSISHLKSQIDGGQVFVKIKCYEKSGQTLRKPNNNDIIVFDYDFFYNYNASDKDDDIMFQLYRVNDNLGASKALLSSSKVDRSSKVSYVEGQLLGTTKTIQPSRQSRKRHDQTLQITSKEGKAIGKVHISLDYYERQAIVGGIKAPNLSLKPDQNIKSSLTLENKYAAYKNLYSFLDGNETPNCEFFPKKFRH